MRTYGTILTVCGLIITACEVYEFFAGTIKSPVLPVVGLMFLVGGIAALIRASRRARGEAAALR